ncbi:MAG: hypothetical protein HY286_18490 [Planctomycetes bacterium]|nr:hypothetical protein [Planctomycetota bacterium]
MVGCHRGVVENSTFIHTENGGTGIQMKGGSSDVAIRANRFENAGSRAVNIGGSTGSPYFRPALKAAPFAEARNITVERNTFIGSQCPVAFVGVDGAVVRFNTIFAPGKWAIRILQETTDEGFIHCRNGKFMDNIVVFDSAHWGEGGVNIGPATEASTFEFARNFWYCIDSPGRSRPTLPTKEKDGVHGIDPKFRDVTKRDFRLMPDSPARDYGADAPGSVTTKPRRY